MAEKIAVITGGTRGLGRALSNEFAKQDYEVVALYLKDNEAAHVLEKEWRESGLTGRCVQMDITKEIYNFTPWGAAKEIVLVNNAAAGFFPKPLHLLSWNDFQEQMEVTIKGGFLLMQALYRMPKPTPRRTVINILSEVTLGDAPKGFLAYALAKQAMLHLSKTWAREQTSEALRILCASPGFMETAMTEPWPEALKNVLKKEGNSLTSIAEKIRELAESGMLPGKGENYEI